VKTANENRTMEIGEIETILAYADDVVVLENSKNEVERSTIISLKQVIFCVFQYRVLYLAGSIDFISLCLI
jgi:hypothetical protein